MSAAPWVSWMSSAHFLSAAAPIVGTLVVAGARSSPEACFSGLPMDCGGYIAGYDSLPGGDGVVLRCSGSRLESVSGLLGTATRCAVGAANG